MRRRRPTPGAQRPKRPISIGVRAFGRWSACADRKSALCVGGGRRLARKRLRRPISIGGKACADREGVFCVGGGRRPARQRLERPISIGAEPTAGGRHACRMNSASRAFGPRSACADRENPSRRRGRRLARQRLKRPISIGAEPSAGGRHALTEKHPPCALKDGSSQLNSGRAEANA